VSEEQKAAKKTRMISQLYDYDFQKGTIKLKNKKCPRCGNFMALHKSPIQRWTCGSCSYTDYVKDMH
jgi:small subunit ribosomal protein S27Ae